MADSCVMTSPYRYSLANRIARGLLALPPAALSTLSGVRRPVERDGRILQPALAGLLGLAARAGVDRTSDDAWVRREELDRVTAVGMPTRTDVRVVDRVVDLNGQMRPVRVYRPFGITEALPGVVFYHGGGWVTGGLDSHDGVCRVLAAEARAVVVAVDYRLAPEHPFPAAVDDAIAGYAWTVAHTAGLGIVPGRVGVMGDSAGATLAAVVSQQVTGDDAVPAPVAQGLVYPSTNAHMDSPSIELFAEGFFLSRASLEWYRARYLTEEAQRDDVRVSPGLADDVSGLPAALVVTAGFDPLRDEGDAYAARLADAGVPVVHRCYDDMVHGFFGMGVLPGGLATIEEICAAMGTLLHDPAD